MLNKDELTLNNTERKLLWGIYETLQEIKTLLVPATAEQTQESKVETSLEGLKRNDLMALVKALPADKKPESWSKLSNKELINLLKKEGA
jgi:hypothetical protein